VIGGLTVLTTSEPTSPAPARSGRQNVEHNDVLHERVVIVTINTLPIPRVDDSERIEIDPLGQANDGISHVNVRFGYMETPDVPRLRLPVPIPDPDRGRADRGVE
jgi:KUP system potassium uptake protein